MEQSELLGRLVRCLEGLGVRYFVTGSLAAMAWGEPRMTNDIDLVAELRPEHVPGLVRCFPAPDFYLSEEAAREAIRFLDQFNIIHSASGLKADILLLRRDAFDASRLARARRVRTLADLEASYSAPEDLIVKKLDFYREGGSEKHLRDIAGILKVSGAALDLEYVRAWVERLGLEEAWRAVREHQERREGDR